MAYLKGERLKLSVQNALVLRLVGCIEGKFWRSRILSNWYLQVC